MEKENKETKQRYDERFEKIMRNWKGVNYDSLRLEQLKEEYGPNYVDHLDEL
ncbi:MAG: hypothetical protein IJJ68_02455 [Prevotella sp.]|nr:hypothetical protein [Prevotella sp.]